MVLIRIPSHSKSRCCRTKRCLAERKERMAAGGPSQFQLNPSTLCAIACQKNLLLSVTSQASMTSGCLRSSLVLDMHSGTSASGLRVFQTQTSCGISSLVNSAAHSGLSKPTPSKLTHWACGPFESHPKSSVPRGKVQPVRTLSVNSCRLMQSVRRHSSFLCSSRARPTAWRKRPQSP